MILLKKLKNRSTKEKWRKAMIYSPLNDARKEIRLLKIKPSYDENTPISCEITVSSLEDEPSYSALSYCWGPENPTTFVTINGSDVGIRPNLAAALRHLRYTGDAITTPIWIDALCINQQDINERNSQVAIMRSIYLSAQEIHIWLGNSGNVSKQSLQVLAELAQHSLNDMLVPWIKQIGPLTLQKLDQLAFLVPNPYWQRTWILQEASLVRPLFIHAHRERVMLSTSDRNAFHVMHRNLWQLEDALKPGFWAFKWTPSISRDAPRAEIRKQSEYVRTIFSRLNLYTKITVRSIMDSLLLFRRSLASDDRDKIYGLLGLLPEIFNMLPDYNKSVREVYCEATVQLIERMENLAVLLQACSNNPGLPSWVPDFSKPSRLPDGLARLGTDFNLQLDANIRITATDGDFLLTRGYTFDHIHKLEPGVTFGPTSPSSAWQCWTRWCALYSKHLESSLSADPNLAIAHLYRHISGHSLDMRWTISQMSRLVQRLSTSTSNNEEQKIIEKLGHLVEGVSTSSTRKNGAEDMEELFLQFLSRLSAADENGFQEGDEQFLDFLVGMIETYDLFVTKSGRFGLIPRGNGKISDPLMIIAGAPLPFCVRDVTRLSSKHKTVLLKTPCAVSGEYPQKSTFIKNIKTRQSVVEGGAVVAEAVRRFGNAARVDEVFQKIYIG
ncbi:hypothetical protein M433DRAFT_84197 [Acidomyces richmondensis BFW]|nr:MAG: hypothetical protein FE78DRAFT_177611 [Acidomyces sp. 'richmondensis']KYG48234.1 hypothetical protein M433DRAFT_84197 [Acidomyces richmondensis BFW]